MTRRPTVNGRELKPYEAPTASPTDYRVWEGFLTTDNVIAIRDRIAWALTGKRFTTVTVLSFFGYQPEVHTGMVLQTPVHAERKPATTEDPGEGTVWFSDGHTSFSWSSEFTTQDEARRGDPDHAVRVAFEWAEGQPLVRVSSVNPDGGTRFDVFAVEPEQVER